MPADPQHWIVAIEAYVGDDTAILVEGGERGRLYAVVAATGQGASIVDNGYRSRAEAKKAWPNAR